MGTICILLGLILLIGCTGAGFFASNAVVSNELYMSLLGMTNASMVYVAIVGLCVLIGLLICLSLVMNGLIYNRLGKIARQKKHRRQH